MDAARTSLVVFFLLGLAACGGPAQTTHTIRVAPEVLSSAGRCESFDGGVAAPNSMIRCQTDLGPLFATILEDCEIPEKFTFQATTRQLLVGITGMSIVSQTPVTIGGGKVLHSVVRGAIDASPVLLSLFTSRRKGCVTDLVMWRELQEGETPNDSLTPFTNASRELASILAPPTITAQEEPGD